MPHQSRPQLAHSKKLMQSVTAALALLLIAPAFAVQPSAKSAARNGSDARQTADERIAILWEEEAMRRGQFICTNPNHHHKFSAQMMMLREDRAEDTFAGGR